MGDFRAWVRQQRTAKRMTQTECAARAGMKLQQWSQIEKEVKQARPDTVRAVAIGLQVPAEVALSAAGYAAAVEPAELDIARRLGPIVERAAPEDREAIIATLESVAAKMVEIAA